MISVFTIFTLLLIIVVLVGFICFTKNLPITYFYSYKYVFLIIIGLTILFHNLYLCTNFLTFFIFIEAVNCIYFFFFLTNFTLQINGINFKTLIIFYLWVSFWTAFIYGLGLGLLFYDFGTVDFFELNLLIHKKNSFGLHLILISLFLKLGLPGVHFWKTKIYQWLSFDTLIFFSSLTLIYNLILIGYLLQLSCLHTFNSLFFVFFFLFSFFFIVIKYATISTLFEFFFLSTIISFLTLLILLI